MLTVSADPVVVESQLSAGVVWCGCAGVLAPWGHARERTVVGGDRFVRVRPRRGRCRTCRVTHVLLPAGVLLRRGYGVEVIGRVLELAALGVAARRVALMLTLARSTVRGWLARFRRRAELLRGHFTGWLLWLAPSASRLDPVQETVADAVAALAAAGGIAVEVLDVASVWQFASLATGGRWSEAAELHWRVGLRRGATGRGVRQLSSLPMGEGGFPTWEVCGKNATELGA